MTVYKIKAGRVPSSTLNDFIGIADTIFFDHINGNFRISDGTTTGLINYFFFGGNNRAIGDTAGTFMNGYIGEVLIWTRTLTTSEYLAAEAYLTSKWAV